MAVVVISSAGEGDRAGGSLDVKAPGGREIPGQIRPGGRATWQAAAKVKQEPPKLRAPREADCERVGSAEPFRTRRRPVSASSQYWTRPMSSSPGS